MNYPKALYKGKQYTDWAKFCDDLAKHEVLSCIVTSESHEKEKRSEGFVDAADLMTAEAEPTKKSWPRMNAAERKAYKEAKGDNSH